MTLILDLPSDVDERLQRDAEQKGIPKELLAADIIARSVGASSTPESVNSGFWSPVSFESLAREQGAEPLRDFERWLANLPGIEGAEDLVERIAEARRERRETEKART